MPENTTKAEPAKKPEKKPAEKPKPKTAADVLRCTQCWSAGRIERFLKDAGDQVADELVKAKDGTAVQRILDLVADEKEKEKERPKT